VIPDEAVLAMSQVFTDGGFAKFTVMVSGLDLVERGAAPGDTVLYRSHGVDATGVVHEVDGATLTVRFAPGLDQAPDAVAPGFRIGNVFVMAGVPMIMQAMLDAVAPFLNTGTKMLSETVRADLREGDIGTELGEIARAHPAVMIGSYPFFDEKRGPNTNIIVRSRDAASLATAKAAVEAMLDRVRATL